MSDHDYWLSVGDQDYYGEEPEEEEIDPDFASLAATDPGEVNDPRDATPEPPAYLDPVQVHHMQRMVRDAAENGDRPWPYTIAAAKAA